MIARRLAALTIPALIVGAGFAVSSAPVNAATPATSTPTETAFLPIVWVQNDSSSLSAVGIADSDHYAKCLTFTGPATGCVLLPINHAFQNGMPGPVRGFYSGRGASVYFWAWQNDASGIYRWYYKGCVNGPVWQTLDYRYMDVRAFTSPCPVGKSAPAAPNGAPS